MNTDILQEASHLSGKKKLFATYLSAPSLFDEYFAKSTTPRTAVEKVVHFFNKLSEKDFLRHQELADNYFKTGGITFTVYSDSQGIEKIFPFDFIPRIITKREWELLDRALKQRLEALNCFLYDVYHDGHILKDKIIPSELIFSASGYMVDAHGITPPGGTYIHVAGIDVIRDKDGSFLVLEDNLRTPSGVSYVLANRWVSKQLLQPLLNQVSVQAVDHYPMQLRNALLSLLPPMDDDPFAVILTPGRSNSAYFEHGFLAQHMGFELVEGQDLFVENRKVYAKTTQGPRQVHVMYRRVDDTFLDPCVFRKDSLLGVAGLMDAYAAGNIILANAIGNGVADDKAIFNYVPDMIRYYLSETPLLAQVPTYLCEDSKSRQHVLQNLDQLVVKVVDSSGGYGMVFGPQAGAQERSATAAAIYANPRNFIAQPLVELSTCPTLVGTPEQGYTISPRRVDFRPYAITGKSTWILPGGLTRVALENGSYVVNSSQGGGSKDTWIVEDGNK